MKILMLNWRDIKHPNHGGAEIYTHEILKRLVSCGHKITLFSAKFKDSKKREVIDGIEIIRAGNKYTVYLIARNYYKKYFSKENFDIIIDQINTIPFFTPDFVKNGEKLTVLIHQLAREFWFYETKFPINLLGYYFFENWWLKKYKDIPTITVSNSTKKDLEELGYNKISIVYNGLNVEPLNKIPLKNKNPTIIFVGRITNAKKPQDVINCFKEVKKEIKTAELWVVGDGCLKKKLESKKTEGVKFFGYLDCKTKNELVKKAWIIAVSGIREGWGQIITDANALGTPAVGYNIQGLKDSIVDGKTGLLVENNPQAMADAILKILKDDKLREQLSKNALEWSREFSWDNSAKESLKILESLK